MRFSFVIACVVCPVAARSIFSTFAKTNNAIMLFPRELASSIGRELEPVGDESRTHYDGAAACVVSLHGQRSAACSKFVRQRDPIEYFDQDKVSRNHPLRAT